MRRGPATGIAVYGLPQAAQSKLDLAIARAVPAIAGQDFQPPLDAVDMPQAIVYGCYPADATGATTEVVPDDLLLRAGGQIGLPTPFARLPDAQLGPARRRRADVNLTSAVDLELFGSQWLKSRHSRYYCIVHSFVKQMFNAIRQQPQPQLPAGPLAQSRSGRAAGAP